MKIYFLGIIKLNAAFYSCITKCYYRKILFVNGGLFEKKKCVIKILNLTSILRFCPFTHPLLSHVQIWVFLMKVCPEKHLRDLNVPLVFSPLFFRHIKLISFWGGCKCNKITTMGDYLTITFIYQNNIFKKKYFSIYICVMLTFCTRQ